MGRLRRDFREVFFWGIKFDCRSCKVLFLKRLLLRFFVNYNILKCIGNVMGMCV